ncbi:hypothetical protein FD754_001699 [Muntiacus muntjak]|uniref:60S ribosomal protein L21 n=1 Tax=Muntiacus muntjak TaxID=9888 RepID=A0A5N3W7X5_MUNMU|nr:hypothetical protein FD754_001699 [Muntiacus muntjak]
MTSRKGKRRGTLHTSSRPFGELGIVPLATYMHIYEKCYHGKTGRVYITQHAVGVTVNKQVKGKIVVNTINKKETKEKGAWVQMKHQYPLPGEVHCVRINVKELKTVLTVELLEPILYEFMA